MKSPIQVKRAIAVAIAKNLAMGIPYLRNARVRAGRTAAALPSVEYLDTYAYNLLVEVTRHTGPVAGKSVLEIGPGDNILAGLALLAAGARSYTAMDRFPGPYASAEARRWYELLRGNWPSHYPGLPWPGDLDPATIPENPRIRIVREGVETARDIGRFDLVCSYVVAEHVVNPDAFAKLTRRALGDGGVALHVIDFGGHEWNALGDPFLFLKFPEPLWRLMGSNRGLPNRVRFGAYMDCFKRAGLSIEVVDRKVVEFDPADAWVRSRADEDFLTHWAVVKLTAT